MSILQFYGKEFVKCNYNDNDDDNDNNIIITKKKKKKSNNKKSNKRIFGLYLGLT
jgi:hypothetical protein